MAAKKHTHKYRRVMMYSTPVWSCALPDCSHYMPEHLTEMMPGKSSLCWGCGESFILDGENMKDDFPMCNSCRPTAVSAFVNKELT